jgi:hypothetical protein
MASELCVFGVLMPLARPLRLASVRPPGHVPSVRVITLPSRNVYHSMPFRRSRVRVARSVFTGASLWRVVTLAVVGCSSGVEV